MQKFLLVAPLTVDPVSRRVAAASTSNVPRHTQMRSRNQFLTGDLGQLIESIAESWPEAPAVPASSPAVSVSLQDIRLFRVAGQAFVTARATLAAENRRVDSVEEALTGAVATMVLQRWDGVGVKWVSRTRIADATMLNDDWMLRDEDTQRVDVGSASAPQVLALGWGNNQLETDATVDPVLEAQLLSGLIDAQVLWVQLDEIAGSSESIIKAYGEGHQEMLQGAASFQASRRLSRQMALHHLYYDKVLLNVQGMRGHVGRAALKSWRYPDLSKRILHRVREIDQLVQQEDQNSRRKYQGLVENVLLAIGVISLVQLVVALAQMAYTEGVVTHPDTGSRLSLLRDLRNANLDGVVVSSIVVALLLFGWILWHKRVR
ncbi:MAG: hypothetical protein ABI268_02590 [Rhodanobacter sp.]